MICRIHGQAGERDPTVASPNLPHGCTRNPPLTGIKGTWQSIRLSNGRLRIIPKRIPRIVLDQSSDVGNIQPDSKLPCLSIQPPGMIRLSFSVYAFLGFAAVPFCCIGMLGVA